MATYNFGKLLLKVSVLLVTVLAGGTYLRAQTYLNSIAQLQTCLDATSTGDCYLASGSYTVDSTTNSDLMNAGANGTLQIHRSGFTISGDGEPGATILLRGSTSLANMMAADNGIYSVTIENLTFDGNRYGFGTGGSGLSCLGVNSSYWDLNLTGSGMPATGPFIVQWVDFINAPSWAVLLGGSGSSVSVSNFGQGGYGVGPSGGSAGTETGSQTATRSTAFEADDSYNGAWYNAISYAGTAGITLNGSNQYAYGNWLFQNRYEIPSGMGGGQLTLNPGSYAGQVAGNVINGNNWQTGADPADINGCSVQPNTTLGGMEIYGDEHGFWNNEVYQNTGGGMVLTGDCTGCQVGQITISGTNPWDSTDTVKYIEGNGSYGILFRAAASGSYSGGTATGTTLDNINAVNNALYGVGLYGVTNDTSHTNPINGGYYIGFINGSCMSGNSSGPVTSPGSTLTYQTPSSYSVYKGGSCPTPPAGTATPAPSGISGWPW